jgi:hypothetical protein
MSAAPCLFFGKTWQVTELQAVMREICLLSERKSPVSRETRFFQNEKTLSHVDQPFSGTEDSLITRDQSISGTKKGRSLLNTVFSDRKNSDPEKTCRRRSGNTRIFLKPV